MGLVDLRGPLAEHLGKLAMQAAGRGDSALWRQYRLRIAQMRLEMGDIEDARNVLTELLKTDSKDKATLRAIAHVDELEERWDAASATYRRLVGLEDEHGIVSAALKLAETCEKAGRLADARGGLERARMAAPDDAALRQRLAWLYEQLGALKELAELVLEEARAAGDVAPRFEGLMRAGQLFLEHAQDPSQTQEVGVAAAIAPLEEAHALRPTDLDCAALLSDAYVGGGRFDEAQDLLQRTIGTFKGRRARELSALYHRLARVAEILDDKPTELQHLTTALDMDAQNGVVASELAYLAMELGNYEVAQRALRADHDAEGSGAAPEGARLPAPRRDRAPAGRREARDDAGEARHRRRPEPRERAHAPEHPPVRVVSAKRLRSAAGHRVEQAEALRRGADAERSRLLPCWTLVVPGRTRKAGFTPVGRLNPAPRRSFLARLSRPASDICSSTTRRTRCPMRSETLERGMTSQHAREAPPTRGEPAAGSPRHDERPVRNRGEPPPRRLRVSASPLVQSATVATSPPSLALSGYGGSRASAS